MAYNEALAERLKSYILQKNIPELVEKKMFGGICHLYKGKMAIGIVKDSLCVRVIPEKYEAELAKNHVDVMDFTGRVMKNFLYVSPPAFETEEQLDYWIDLGIEHAKSVLKEK